jgi:serine/threonine protein kinase
MQYINETPDQYGSASPEPSSGSSAGSTTSILGEGEIFDAQEEFEEWCEANHNDAVEDRIICLMSFVRSKELDTWVIDPHDYPGLNHAAAYFVGGDLTPGEPNYDALPEDEQKHVREALDEKFTDQRMGNQFGVNQLVNYRWNIVSDLSAGGCFNRGILLVDDLHDRTETIQGILKLLPSQAMEPGYAQREIEVLKCLKHPNIVELYDSKLPQHRHDTPWMVTEYCDKGTLKDEVRNHQSKGKAFTELLLWQILESLARAVGYCHNGPTVSGTKSWVEITHRDIILDNIFLKSSKSENSWEYPVTIKLGDWGCAVSATEWASAKGKISHFPPIEASYTPPEGAVATEAVDIYQVGLVMQCLYAMKEAPKAKGPAVSKKSLLPPSRAYSLELFQLIKVCLLEDPEDRPSACDVVEAVQERRATLIESGQLGE